VHLTLVAHGRLKVTPAVGGVLAIGQDCAMVSSPRWLGRYQDGRREEVWQELRQLGSGIRESGWAEQARLVCDEMAHRARHNIELIVDRLSNDGYRFHTNDDDQTPVQPHIPPTPAAAAHADWLQQRFGEVPMTLLSWVRIVGDVWLVGTHPRWPTSAAADPLVIRVEGSHYPGEPTIREYFDDEWTRWLERRAKTPAPPACSCSRWHPTGSTRTTPAEAAHTGSSFPTAALTDASPGRPPCRSCRT
jgi:hypothetical protein